MADQNPYKNFGLADKKEAVSDTGHAFLMKLLSATHPSPPFSQVCEIWLVEVEIDRSE